MARIDIPFVIKKQHISQPTREKLVAGGQNYFYATFTIGDGWEDITNLKAVFTRNDLNKVVALTATESGYECKIPWEVMPDKGAFHVGIFGGDRMLTNWEYVVVLEGCCPEGGEPLAPTPDWFTQVENDLSEMKEDVETVSSMQEQVDEVVEATEIIKTDVEGIQQQINEEAHFRGYLSTNAKIQDLEATPNDFAYSAESGTKWVYDAESGWQDTGTPVPDQLTPASDATPLVNGVATPGESNEYARGDHRHPTDTTRVGFSDYASPNKAGVVKTSINWGIGNNSETGLWISAANEDQIKNRKEFYRPIVPATLELAVKSVGDGYYATEEQVGDINTALNAILTLQNELIGG